MSIHRLFQCGLKSPKYSNHRQKAIPYIAVFQSLRSLRTATPSRLAEARAAAGISILAVLADRNHCVRPSATLTANFNRRGPCGPRPDSFTALSLHQSYFNPCGPCGPRPAIQADTAAVLTGFQSSRSLRTATNLVRKLGHILGISILAVLADRDWSWASSPLPRRNFNPRGPCGPRQCSSFPGLCPDYISILAVLADRDPVAMSKPKLTPMISILAVLADRDTVLPIGDHTGCAISILAVLADRDACWKERRSDTAYFNPRGPCGPRPLEELPEGAVTAISILAVLADRDAQTWPLEGTDGHFNPRGPCGPRRHGVVGGRRGAGISILAVLADRDGSPGSAGTNTSTIFQSSRSLRTATALCDFLRHPVVISILAVLADRDYHRARKPLI